MSSARSGRNSRSPKNQGRNNQSDDNNNNSLATAVPSFSSSSSAIGTIRNSSASLESETSRPQRQWHQSQGMNRMFGKPHDPTLTYSLLNPPSDLHLDVAEEKSLDERTRNVVFSRRNEEEIVAARQQNSCSNNMIIRTIRNQHARKAIVLAINLLSIAILYGVAINRLSDDYSEEQSSTAKESMIDLNALGFTFNYWCKSILWINILHVFYSIYQDANAPDPIASLNRIYAGLVSVNNKIDDANDTLRLFDAGTPLRKALEALSTPGATPLAEASNHIIKEVGERVELARDDIEALTKSLGDVATKVTEVQNVVDIQKGNEAKKAEAKFARNMTAVDNFLAKTNELTVEVATARASFSKETPAGKQTIDSLDETPVPANNWDLAFMVTQVLSLYDDTTGKDVTTENCKAALLILISISEKLFEINQKKPKVASMKETLQNARGLVDGTEIKLIKESEHLVNHVVATCATQLNEQLEEEQKSESHLRYR